MGPRPVATTLICLFLTASAPRLKGELPAVDFTAQPGQVTVVIGGAPVATYVYRDPQISRPYFFHVRTASGIQVTRNHPPVEGTDVMDHPTFHPGLWMAFGDVSGADGWRLKAPVEHIDFATSPSGGPGRGGFAVRNRYYAEDDPSQVICEEVCRFTFRVRTDGWLLLWDAQFTGEREFSFGDQEEMGLGIRVATPIRVETGNRDKDPRIVAGNGTILSADGRRNGAQVWGHASRWCDYRGAIDERVVGITILCHPDNFRPSWFHARDYGLLLANPFGRDAFRQGDRSQVAVRPGEVFRLRYGVLVHEGPAGSVPNLEDAYARYVAQSAQP